MRKDGGEEDGLRFGLAVIKMPVLPVQPGMAKFMGQDIPPPCHRELFPQINGLQLVVPNAIGIRVAAIHFTV